jgi:MSHA biogenesis protein MshN
MASESSTATVDLGPTLPDTHDSEPAIENALTNDESATSALFAQATPAVTPAPEAVNEPNTTLVETAPESTEHVAPSQQQVASVATPIEKDEPTAVFSMAPSNGGKAQLSLLRERARIALADDDKVAAVEALQAIVTDYPEDTRAPKQLASLLFSQQRFREAQAILENALSRLPADNAMRIMLSRIAYKTGNIQGAYDTLAAHPFPKLAEVELLSFRASLAERLKQYELASDDYRLLLAKEPQNAKWWLGLGVSQDKLSRVSEAIESYQQAQELNQLPAQVSGFLKERITILARQS